MKCWYRQGTQLLLTLVIFAKMGSPNTAVAYTKTFPEVIYGNDNRQDLYEVRSHKFRDLARSTAIITKTSQIQNSSLPNINKLETKTLREAQNLCLSERFVDQPVGGSCSGFLVKENILVTAGHCITSKNHCRNSAIVFDFAFLTGDEQLSYVEKNQIYYCEQIIARKQISPRGLDYAIIKLDRPVKDRPVLKLRRFGKVSDAARLSLIGHPSGLPTKIANGGVVRDNSDLRYFITNTDSFGGNSGSAVFNQDGLVEGILVRGEKDYIKTKDKCWISNECDAFECRGEDVIRSSTFAHLIP